MPYVGFMICFILYTTYDLEFYDTYIVDQRVKESSTLRILIWIFLSYFSALEIRQAFYSGLKVYLKNGWNYMDLSIFISIIVAEILHARFYVNDLSLIDNE